MIFLLVNKLNKLQHEWDSETELPFDLLIFKIFFSIFGFVFKTINFFLWKPPQRATEWVFRLFDVMVKRAIQCRFTWNDFEEREELFLITTISNLLIFNEIGSVDIKNVHKLSGYEHKEQRNSQNLHKFVYIDNNEQSIHKSQSTQQQNNYRLPKLYGEKVNSGLVNALLWPEPTVLNAEQVGEYPSNGLYNLDVCGLWW